MFNYNITTTIIITIIIINKQVSKQTRLKQRTLINK